ncbi:hypothetical protein JXA40_02115 [bacterium]|nr:hypothetical protein [candidate division CSSED10-310 bacterium]
MKINRNIILDLLPLYAAGEVSEDTRILVEEYLESDPELARTALHFKNRQSMNDIPVPLKREDRIDAYLEAKRIMLKRTIIWASVAAICIVSFLSLGAVALFKLFQFFP